MALDTSNEGLGVIDILIDKVEKGLGDLAVKVYPGRAEDTGSGETTQAGKPPKTATEDHAADIRTALASISGLAEDLVTFMEDGTLPQTDALMSVVETLLSLKEEGTELRDVFAVGNAINGGDLNRLEDFLAAFGEALTQARESAAEAPADASDAGPADTDAPAVEDGGDAGGGQPAPTARSVAGEQPAGEGDAPPEDDTEVEAATGGDMEPDAPGLTDVALDAQDLLSVLDDLDARIMDLLQRPMDTESSQVVDSIGFSTYLERTRGLIQDVQGFMEGFLADPSDPDAALSFLAGKREDAEAIIEVIDAIDATLAPEDATPAGPDTVAEDDPETDAEPPAEDGGSEPEQEPTAEMDDDGGDVDGGGDVEGDDVGGDVEGGEPTAVEEPREPEEPAEPEITLLDVTTEAQDLLDELSDFDDLVFQLLQLDFDSENTRLVDGISWTPYLEETRGRIQGIGAEISEIAKQAGPDLKGAMAFLAGHRDFLADAKDFVASIQATLGAEGGPPVAVGTDGADGPTRTDVTLTAEQMLGDLDDLDAELLELLIAPYDPEAPSFADNVSWSRLRDEVQGLRSEVRTNVLDMISGPEPDIQGALDYLAEKQDYIDNLRDFVDSMRDGSAGAADEPAAAGGAEPAPGLSWSDQRPPVSRDELLDLGNELLGNIFQLDAVVMDLLTADYDPENVQITDMISWSGFSDEIGALKTELLATLPGLLEGDLDSAEFTEADIQAAYDFLVEKKEEFDAIKGRVDAILGAGGGAAGPLDPLAVEMGRIWGDPHFVGADGGNYDVQGQAGSIYNILSDDGLQVNARFDQFGGADSGRTVMGALGITLGDDQVSMDKNGAVQINGETVGAGTYLDGKVTVTATGELQVREQEYSFTVVQHDNPAGNYLNIENIRSDNAAADGVLPSGLWGVTVDYDDDARNGDAGVGTQGGGAIEDLDGNITQRGDRTTVRDYEVGGLFDTGFANHNAFGRG